MAKGKFAFPIDFEKDPIIMPVFMASFPHLFKPQGFEEGDPERFSVEMVWDGDTDLTAAKKAVNKARVKAWGKDKEKWPKKRRSPFRNGSEREDIEGYEGKIFARASCTKKPPIRNAAATENILDEEEIYPGVQMRAKVVPVAYDHKGNIGIRFMLLSLQKVKDGKRLGGSNNGEGDFESVDDGSNDESNYESDDEG